MPGEAIVTIEDKQWSVGIASAPWELVQGLGNITQIPPGTGMLFDTGMPQHITVTTGPLLFPLDIVFMDGSLVITETHKNVPPGQTITSETPARYFLEVNAGELGGVIAGERASVEMLQVAAAPMQMPSWAQALFSFLGLIIVGGFVVTVSRRFIKAALGDPQEPPFPAQSPSQRYHGAYLHNWQYGGYSYVEEDPGKPERLWVRGMADYVSPDKVIAIAEKEGLPHISLAGGFWEEVGYKGWGQKISVAEAKSALSRAREHVPDNRKLPRAEYVWIRMGDAAEYEHFDSPYEAGRAVGERLALRPQEHQVLSCRYRASGVEIAPYYTDRNYISLFWGDKDAQWVADLSIQDRREFERGVEDELGFKPVGKKPTRYDVSVSSFVERDRLGIWIVDNRTDETIVEWWDDEARQMFEDGFFKPATFTRAGNLGGAAFIDSVLDYAEDVDLLAKENPRHSSSPQHESGKIKARSITLQRAEGATGRDHFSRRTLTATKERSVWQQADSLLLEWSQTAPKGGGYHKVDFTVTYEDGETYSGRYDLRHWSEEYPSLAKHMRSFVAFHAGEYCPPHMTEEQYQRIMQTEPFTSQKPKYRKFLEKYEIGGSSTPISTRGRGSR